MVEALLPRDWCVELASRPRRSLMLVRLALVAVALVVLTAFAPASCPKRPTKVNAPLHLKRLQGDWKVVSLWRYGPNRSIAYRIEAWQVIRIDRGQWSFCQENNGVVAPKTVYDLGIESGKQPVTIDFKQPGQARVWMMGIVRLQGDQLEVLYKPHATERPASFDDPPADFYLFKLTRKK